MNADLRFGIRDLEVEGSTVEQLSHVFSQRDAMLRIIECEFEKRLEVAFKVANVEPMFTSRKPDADPLMSALQQQPDRVGELNLAPFPGFRFRKSLENNRAKHVARRDRQPTGSFGDT